MKKIYILLSFLISINSYSSNEISWKEISIPYNYLLGLDLKENSECKKKLDYLLEETLKKNKGKNLDYLWAENKLVIPRCVEKKLNLYIGKRKNKEKIEDNTPIIKEWNEITVEINFILSSQLDKNNCSLIWEKQIPEFKKRNKSIENVNNLEVGQKINIQTCKKINETLASDKEKIKDEYEKYYWLAFLALYKKNEDFFKNGGGISLNLDLLNLIEYKLDFMYLDHLFLFNKFLIPILSYEKESLSIGTTLVNNFDKKSFSYFNLSYKRRFDKKIQLTVDLGSTLTSDSGLNYIRTELSYKRLGIFYTFFEEENILEDSSIDYNRYNLLGLGFRF